MEDDNNPARGFVAALAMTALIAMVIFLLITLGGCATNGVQFSERIVDPETGAVNQTSFSQTSRVTWGSTLGEGAGNMQYNGPDWQLGIGAAASNAQAGDPTETLKAIVSLGQMFAPLIGAQAARIQQPQPAGGNSNIDWAAIVREIGEVVRRAELAADAPP